jgi:hypothetical protein
MEKFPLLFHVLKELLLQDPHVNLLNTDRIGNFLNYNLRCGLIFKITHVSKYWGCTFGITAFYHIWIFMPMMRYQFIVFKVTRELISILVSGK